MVTIYNQTMNNIAMSLSIHGDLLYIPNTLREAPDCFECGFVHHESCKALKPFASCKIYFYFKGNKSFPFLDRRVVSSDLSYHEYLAFYKRLQKYADDRSVDYHLLFNHQINNTIEPSLRKFLTSVDVFFDKLT